MRIALSLFLPMFLLRTIFDVWYQTLRYRYLSQPSIELDNFDATFHVWGTDLVLIFLNYEDFDKWFIQWNLHFFPFIVGLELFDRDAFISISVLKMFRWH
jgi:hypothetical protein